MRAERIFDLITSIGSGGQADVYLARERATYRFYAVKLLREAWDFYARQHFQLEVHRQLRCAGSSKVVGVVAYNFEASRPFVVLEWMHRGSLADLMLKSPPPWRPAAAVKMVLGIAEALRVVHAQGLVHRDNKPANVLLDDNLQPRLNDLGIAATAMNGFVWANGFVGTDHYAAPEQLQNFATFQSDIYPLGVMLAELLTGARTVPFYRTSSLWQRVDYTHGAELEYLVHWFGAGDWRRRPTAAQAAKALAHVLNRIRSTELAIARWQERERQRRDAVARRWAYPQPLVWR